MLNSRMRVALFQANPMMGDIAGNSARLLLASRDATHEGADLLVAPELYLLGYPPDDLVQSPGILVGAKAALDKLARDLPKDLPVLLGAPVADHRGVLNAAVLIADGKWRVVSEKMALPDYNVFDDSRVFAVGDGPGIIQVKGKEIGVMICEEIWVDDPTQVLLQRAQTPLDMVITLNASPFEHNRILARYDVAKKSIQHTRVPMIYVAQVGGQDEIVFDGGSFVMDGHGKLLAQFPSFEENIYYFDTDKKHAAIEVPQHEKWQDIYRAIVLGTRDYIRKNGFTKACFGLSGGVDSALVAKIAVDALGAENVTALVMPSIYSGNDTMSDAHLQAKRLGIQAIDAPITAPQQALETTLQSALGAELNDIAGQNIQSRIRGLMLMAYSNQTGAILLTTGNKSEVAVGYATLYGDMNGGFNPIKDLYKTGVYALCDWINAQSKEPSILPSILKRPPSAELKPGQKDQDTLPPYEVLDEVLRALIEGNSNPELLKKFDDALVRKVQNWLDKNEYKRRQAAPGVKVGVKAFGRDRRWPITNKTNF